MQAEGAEYDRTTCPNYNTRHTQGGSLEPAPDGMLPSLERAIAKMPHREPLQGSAGPRDPLDRDSFISPDHAVSCLIDLPEKTGVRTAAEAVSLIQNGCPIVLACPWT